jgi:TonB family protein
VKFLVVLLVGLPVAVLGSAQQQTSNPATVIDAITVDRKGCFGGCPRYTLTLRRQGNSTYSGLTGPRQGLYTARLLRVGDFDQLTKAISEVRFFDLPDVVGPRTSDTEEVAVTVITAQKSKTVTTYNLHDQATAPFAALVTLADGVAAKLPWENLNQPKDGIIGPVPLRRVEPQYTEDARKAKIQGSVIVQVEVRPDGTVAPDSSTIVQGLGMGLDEKAIEAVKQWIFKPAYKDGKPVEIPMPVSVLVEFRL